MGSVAVRDAATQFFFEQAFRFPTGKPLVDQFNGNTNLFAQTAGEAGGFFGHLAARAVEAKRQADKDLLNAVFTHKFAKTAHIFVAINAFEGVVWLGDASIPAGQSKADFAPAVVEREDLALRDGGFWGG